ncbi:MAG: septation protein A [Pseudomonadota bacterium]
MSETSKTTLPDKDGETIATQAESAEGEAPSFLKLLLELGPLVVFFLANWRFDIFFATAAFMAATVIALSLSYIKFRKVPVMPLVSSVFVLVFGALTLWLQDELFIKLKPTIVNLLFAGLLTAGLAFRRPLLKLVLGEVFQLTEIGWRLLTYRWIGFFVFLAILNEVIWRSFSTDFWVSFKLFGVMPITIAFSIAQLPLLQRHQVKRDEI